MHVLAEIHAATAVLTILTPRFSQAVADEIKAEAMAAITDNVDTYLLNLEHVTHIGSAAVGVLVNLMKRVGRERRFELCAPSPGVRKVLRLTRMESIFVIHPTVGEALDRDSVRRRQVG